MKKYPKYKNSGIAWLGDIPEHWGYSKLKKIANFRRGSFPQPYGLAKWYDDENGFPFIQVFDVGKNMKLKPTTKRKISLEATKKSVFIKKGTLVLTLQGSIGRLAVTHYDAYIDRTLLIFQSYNVPIDINYFKHIVAILFEFEEKKAVGSTIKTINKEKLSSFILTIPPKQEQTAIANFLDYKLEKIDRFITKKKQLITLLKEQKAAIINQAVTKGLNPNTKLKPSGIEWLGDIPERWEVRKLKYSVRLNKHISFDKDENSKNKIALENIEGKTGRILELNENPFEGVGTIFKKGDILFGKLRPYLAKVVTPDFEGSCVNELLVLSPKKNDWLPEFLKYRMLSGDFISIVDNSTYGAKMPRASWSFIGGLKISKPSISEQKQIVTHIQTETKKIAKTITTIAKEIALVEEYKTALIAEAVTGKIDVRAFELNKND